MSDHTDSEPDEPQTQRRHAPAQRTTQPAAQQGHHQQALVPAPQHVQGVGDSHTCAHGHNFLSCPYTHNPPSARNTPYPKPYPNAQRIQQQPQPQPQQQQQQLQLQHYVPNTQVAYQQQPAPTATASVSRFDDLLDTVRREGRSLLTNMARFERERNEAYAACFEQGSRIDALTQQQQRMAQQMVAQQDELQGLRQAVYAARALQDGGGGAEGQQQQQQGGGGSGRGNRQGGRYITQNEQDGKNGKDGAGPGPSASK